MAKPIIPLEKNSFSRFIPALIAFMVFLATLFVAVGNIVSQTGEKWSDGITNSMAVQIVPDGNIGQGENQDIVDRALAILKQHSAVENAEIINNEKVIEILSPWFGGGIDNVNLPIPKMIDVKLTKTGNVDLGDLKTELEQISENIIIDDFSDWRERVKSIIMTINGIVYTIILLILTSSGVMITTLTRGLMLMNTKTLNMLILMGATDKFIANDFVKNAFNVALKSSVYGFIIGFVSINLMILINDFSFEIGLFDWLLIFMIVPIVSILSFVVSNITVKMTLEKRFFNIEF